MLRRIPSSCLQSVGLCSISTSPSLTPDEQAIEGLVEFVAQTKSTFPLSNSSSSLSSSFSPSTSDDSRGSVFYRPFLSAILTSTSIHTNLAVEDELHRRLVFASVTDLLREHDALVAQKEKEKEKSSTCGASQKAPSPPYSSFEPFAMSNLPPSPPNSPSSSSSAGKAAAVAPPPIRCLSLLLSYINEPCVVIGRNQNPWKETNLRGIGETHARNADENSSSVEKSGGSNVDIAVNSNTPTTNSLATASSATKPASAVVELARRSSGGGAVYHDLGNVCFSFLTHRTLYDPARSVEVLRQYLLARLGPFVRDEDITTTKRNDLFLFGHKITGSAMKVTSRGCYHHLTLLVASSRPSLGTFLSSRNAWEWCESAGVDSVRSPVTTLAIALRGGRGGNGGDGKGAAEEEGHHLFPQRPSLREAAGVETFKKYPPLVPKDRFFTATSSSSSSSSSCDPLDLLMFEEKAPLSPASASSSSASSTVKVMMLSPYERLLWLASVDAPFSSPLLDSTDARRPSAEAIDAIAAMTPYQQAQLIQRDFCRFYQEEVTVAAATEPVGCEKERGGKGGFLPRLYLSQAIVEPKQQQDVSTTGDHEKEEGGATKRRPFVPFVSSEYGHKKEQLLSIFKDVYPPPPQEVTLATTTKVVNVVDIPKISVDAASHLSFIKRQANQQQKDTTNDSSPPSSQQSSAIVRSDNQKLSDPKSLTEGLLQQQSRVWLLKNTPKFTTVVRIPALGGRGGATKKGLGGEGGSKGWAEWLLSSSSAADESVAATAETSSSSPPSLLPDIIIRTQVSNGGVIESLRCRFDYKTKTTKGGDSEDANLDTHKRADVTEEESDSHWFSAVLKATLEGEALRSVGGGGDKHEEGKGEGEKEDGSKGAAANLVGAMPPFPRHPAFANKLRVASTKEGSVFIAAMQHSVLGAGGGGGGGGSGAFTPCNGAADVNAVPLSLSLKMKTQTIQEHAADCDDVESGAGFHKISRSLHQSIAVGDLSEVQRILEEEGEGVIDFVTEPVDGNTTTIRSLPSSSSSSSPSSHSQEDAAEVMAARLASEWLFRLVQRWEEMNAW